MTHIFRRRCASARAAAVLVLLILPASVSARMVRDLYTVQVPVSGQDLGERLAAFRTGLAQVLVRVSGDAGAAANAKLRAALRDPARFVLEYRYVQAPVPDTTAAVNAPAAGAGAPSAAASTAGPASAPAATPAPAAAGASPQGSTAPGPSQTAPAQAAAAGGTGAPAPALRLRMRFDPDAIRIALQQAGLPVWGSARPTTLIWLAVQDGLQRSIVAEDEQSPLEQALLKAASARGIPVLLPLMDLQDVRDVSFGDLWGGFGGPVRAASKRYGTHAILVGRLRHRAGGGWSGRWTLYVGDHTSRWRTQADTEAQLLTSGVDGLANHLAAQFAVPAGETARRLIRVNVEGVTSLADYARVRGYLSRLNPVLHVITLAVTADRAQFRLEVQGDTRVLEQAIGLGRTLTPAGPAGTAEAPAADTSTTDATAPGAGIRVSTGASSGASSGASGGMSAGTAGATSAPAGGSGAQTATLVYRLVP